MNRLIFIKKIKYATKKEHQNKESKKPSNLLIEE
jgi:hypothetical protein